ncbi:MAG: CBS domain-containing protein [Candidatus Lambdaproteobacteria bacterium]|nr:CBS domain-containing protein [Candidatus Lambdaproteobacteria bacterium]
MDLLSIAHVPAVQVTPENTVLEAVELSLPARVGAVAVIEGGRLVGIFTERDVMLKVVHQRLDPATTRIRDVMSTPVTTVSPDVPAAQVLKTMLDRHIRHMPVSEDGKHVLGMLSIRNVLQYLVQDLSSSLHTMEAYVAAG